MLSEDCEQQDGFFSQFFDKFKHPEIRHPHVSSCSRDFKPLSTTTRKVPRLWQMSFFLFCALIAKPFFACAQTKRILIISKYFDDLKLFFTLFCAVRSHGMKFFSRQFSAEENMRCTIIQSVSTGSHIYSFFILAPYMSKILVVLNKI